MGSKNSQAQQRVEPRRWLVVPTLLLILVGLATSVYLTMLHAEVHSAGGDVDSFCNVSEQVNCVAVASSEYSVFLGVPVAVYGLEFFLALGAVLLLSVFRVWSVRRWDSLIALATAVSLPLCGLLAYVSVSCIQSICIMCCVVYGVVLLLFLLLLVGKRGSMKALFTEGPRELWQVVRKGRGAALSALVVAVAVSQLLWLPGVFQAQASVVSPSAGGATKAWHGQPMAGLTLGPAGAPVRIEEYTDFQCPHCGAAHHVLLQVIRQFAGKVRIEHRDYPLDMACHPRINRPFHRDACRAALYGRCAAKQNKYWPMAAMMFDNRDRLGPDDLEQFAQKVGLDLKQLRDCVRDPTVAAALREDIDRGLKRGVQGTPTFFVNGERYVGLKGEAFWVDKITELLKKQ